MPKLKTIIRQLFKGLILVVGLWIVFVLTTRTLQNSALTQIAELTRTRIEVHSVDFDLNGSVLIKKLVIRPDREGRYDDAILKAETVYARFSIGSLLLLRPRLKEIRLQDFIFNAQYDLDSLSWNVAELKIKAPRAGTGGMPMVRLEKGVLQYTKVKNARVNVVAEVPLDASFGPARKIKNAYSFSATTAQTPGGLGKSSLAGLWRHGYISIDGGISSTDVPAFEKAWGIGALSARFYHDLSKNYVLQLKIRNLRSKHDPTPEGAALVKPAFLEKFGAFAALQRFFSRYQPAGLVDIDLDASGNLQQLGESELAGKIYCKDVSICDQKFPYTVEHLAGQIDFTEKSVLLDNLYGRHSDVELSFNGFSRDFGPHRRYQIRITSNNMALDADLYNALSAKQKKVWSAFSPQGLAAIDYRLSRKSDSQEQRTITVELHHGDAAYKNFPYPLKNLKGTLVFERDSVTISDVVSQWDKRTIALNGKVTFRATEWPMWNISIKANNIPLDSTLVAALPEKQKYLFDRFDTAGTIQIQELIGQIWCTQKSKQPRYSITLQSEQLELNDNLLGLLPPRLKALASGSQPQGKVNISVHLNNPAGADVPDYTVTLDCLRDRINLKSLPYPLRDITGRLTVTKDGIGLHDIAATFDDARTGPNSPTLKIDGQITLVDNEFGPGKLKISADNLLLDEKLCDALPKGIRPLYTRLSPSGRLDLDLNSIEIFDSNTGQKCIDFAGTATLKNCNLRTYSPTTELNATLKIKGLYNADTGLGDGAVVLFADSLRIKGKSLTDLKADISYDPDRRTWLTENLIADSYSGKVAGKFQLQLPKASAAQYMLQVGFEDIDLRQFLLDTDRQDAHRDECTTGKMNGSLSVAAALGRRSSRIGRCRLAISDMQVGRLSPLARLLTVLKLTEPADFAFEQMLVDSYMNNNTLLVRKFDLSGPRVAFNGAGRIDLKTEKIDLTLTARGDRLATDEPSLLQSLTEGLGHAVVRMDVTGKLHDPRVTTTTLPVITETLRILGTRPTKSTQ